MRRAASRQPSLRRITRLIILPLLLVVGCAGKPPAPIEDHSQPGSLRADDRYVVLRGDTLFSIAFRFGLDFRRLAAANAIAAPYTIFPGQLLRLAEADPPAPRSRAQAQQQRKKTASTVAPAVSSPAPTARSSSTPPAAGTAGTTPTVAVANSPAAGAWSWPVQGRVTRRYEKDLHKGLDISGGRGDPVIATAPGTVVYAGSGIAGYGLMLIIRHSDEYLSAYGHNEVLLVDEGEAVQGGQQVARRGSSGTDSVKLHFEIRRRGRPVDPLGLLPPRRGGD